MTVQITNPTIVIVEDSLVARFVHMRWEREGYAGVTADVRRGKSRLLDGESPVGLLITNTPAIFAQFGDRLPLLYLAAMPDPEAAQSFPRCRALRKPFSPQKLVEC